MAELPNPTDPNPSTIHVDREALYTSLPDRVSYLTNFLEFNESDADTLNEAALILEPLIPMLVDRVTHGSRHFASHARRRPDQRAQAVSSLTWEYYDKVGRMHTGEAGLKHRKLAGKEGFRVDHIHLSGLLGWTWTKSSLRVRRGPGTCPYTAAATSGFSSFVPNISSVNRRPSGSAGSSTTSSVTGAESVAWNPQPGGTYTPGELYDTWGRPAAGPTSPKVGRKKSMSTWTKWSVNRGEARVVEADIRGLIG
ncbi:protoglobin protein [Ceratobasidium sp. AG-Ba]|nr:protoglobin protein [Ceratobasidium sp. AG-Ba]